MERQLGPVSLEWNSTQPADVDRLIEWKSRKYHGTALLFSDPTARGIVKELTASKGDDCRGVVSVLFAGARPTAVHLGLLGPRSLAGWFMSYDPALSRFAPGMMAWNPLAKAAGERGIDQIDLGAGQDTYKFALSNNSYAVTGGGVWVSRAEAAARRAYRRLRHRLQGQLSPRLRVGSTPSAGGMPERVKCLRTSRPRARGGGCEPLRPRSARRRRPVVVAGPVHARAILVTRWSSQPGNAPRVVPDQLHRSSDSPSRGA